MKPTEEQLNRIKHALGMDNKEPKLGVYDAYRRSSCYDEPVPEWEELVNGGYAACHSLDNSYLYIVTEKGMQEVANATGLMITYKIEIEPKIKHNRRNGNISNSCKR